jgi:hypothetical protein
MPEMRIVIAKRHGRRGAGLGNELLPWAKGWIASQLLDAHLVGPSWGINQRKYSRNFRTSRFDFLLEDALQRLPHVAFTERDYRATGEIDFGSALKRWATTQGLDTRKSYIVCVEGMWGGYPSIRSARSFLWAKLLNSKDALRNVFEISRTRSRSKLFVAVHMRSLGDGFVAADSREDVRGKFNILIPPQWYLWVCEALRKRFRDRIEFHIFTDRPGPEFNEVVHRLNPGQVAQRGLTECSDLILMAQADLRICSVSSYSLAASFLSDGPYLWYEPQLSLTKGRYTLWGEDNVGPAVAWDSPQWKAHIDGRGSNNSSDYEAPPAFLGSAMNTGDSLPDALVSLLEQRLSTLDPHTNLLEYGSVPQALDESRLVALG